MKKQIYICAVLIIIILAVGFYWYALRPAKITKNCSALAQKLFQTDNLSAQDFMERYNFSYNRCLHDNGIEK